MSANFSGTIAVMLDLEYGSDNIDASLDLCRLANYVLSQEGFSPTCFDVNDSLVDSEYDWEVSIIFVDNQQITELNSEYRNIDKPTDVLSFECDGAIDEDNDEESEPAIGFRVSDFRPKQLGDVFVAVDVARDQAADYGLSLEQELSLLITHGLLHLCHWDHIEDEDALAMEARETQLLSAFWGEPFARHGLDS